MRRTLQECYDKVILANALQRDTKQVSLVFNSSKDSTLLKSCFLNLRVRKRLAQPFIQIAGSYQ